MKKSIVLKSFTVVIILLVTTVCVADEPDSSEEICFRKQNKARDTIEIKTGCHKIPGKADAYPRYECPDSSDKFVPFYLNDEWKVTECPKKSSRPPVVKEIEFEKKCTLRDLGLR